MMKAFALRSQFYFPTQTHSKSTSTTHRSVRLIPSSAASNTALPEAKKPCSSSAKSRASGLYHPEISRIQMLQNALLDADSFEDLPNPDPNPNGYCNSKALVTGAVSVGLVLLVLGMDDGHGNRALALGPEGPLVEEFWENVRRYALYALTVSTGVAYTVFQPIIELLKNPISAVLVIVIIVGIIYIVSQVLSAMVGVSDFSYQYGY